MTAKAKIIKTAKICRYSRQKLSEQQIKEQAYQIIDRSVGGNRGKNWDAKFYVDSPIKENDRWRYNVRAVYDRIGGQASTLDKQWSEIVYWLARTGKNASFRNYPWTVFYADDDVLKNLDIHDDVNEIVIGDEVVPDKPVGKRSEVKNYSEITIDNLSHHFGEIYGRNDQIAIITGAVEAALASEMQQRLHTVLYGDPGCGKTEILRALGRSLGPENEAYVLFDATSATSAGILQMLFDAETIPPVLIIEEIEKADEKDVKWLLGVTDQRGEIRKTNYRIGHKARNVKMLVFATVNNYDKWQNMAAGALASRFFEVYCPRPDRDLCEKILLREVKKFKGDPAWVEPALQLGFDKLHWDDPRKLRYICLSGRERLLDGTYEGIITRTRKTDD